MWNEYIAFLVREGREGKGREGKGREGKGREGKGREGKGREGGQDTIEPKKKVSSLERCLTNSNTFVYK